MNIEQKKLIYLVNGNKVLVVKYLDISVMYKVLWNICNIFNYKNGWGNLLKIGDNSIVVCIERI